MLDESVYKNILNNPVPCMTYINQFKCHFKNLFFYLDPRLLGSHSILFSYHSLLMLAHIKQLIILSK